MVTRDFKIQKLFPRVKFSTGENFALSPQNPKTPKPQNPDSQKWIIRVIVWLWKNYFVVISSENYKCDKSQ